MQKWSDMLARVIPWLRAENDDLMQQLRDAAVAVRQQQQQMAPGIEAQSDYMVNRGELNGFTRQLQIGFQQRNTEE